MGILREMCHDDDDTPMIGIEELPSSHRAAKSQARHGPKFYPSSMQGIDVDKVLEDITEGGSKESQLYYKRFKQTYSACIGTANCLHGLLRKLSTRVPMDMYDTWVYHYANEYMKEFRDVFFEERNSSGSSSTVPSYPKPFNATFVKYSPCKSGVLGKQEAEEYQLVRGRS
jgi:hypothetical protein